MTRYVIRKEKKGAFVFDRKKRSLLTLTEEQVENLMNTDKATSKQVILGLEADICQDGFELINHLDRLNLSDQEYGLTAPNRLYLELTRACNLRCKMCYNVGGQALPRELNLAEWKMVLSQMATVGVFEARFTGGEATLHPDFLEILDYALARGFYTSLATNGVWSEELRHEICQRQIDDVIVSLDGPPEINDQFRVGGSFQKTLKTIIDLKNAGIKKVRINTVLSQQNWRQVEPLLVICEKYDLLLIDFIHPRPFGRGAVTQDIMLTPQDVLGFNRLVEKWRIKYPTVKIIMDFDLFANQEPARHPIVPRIHACPAGREFAFVSPQGNVFPCGVAPVCDINTMSDEEKKLFIAGNLRECDLLSIWHQSLIWQNYRDLQRCKPSKCFACKFWGKKCFGTCPIGAYYENGKLNGEDPYCYSHLL